MSKRPDGGLAEDSLTDRVKEERRLARVIVDNFELVQVAMTDSLSRLRVHGEGLPRKIHNEVSLNVDYQTKAKQILVAVGIVLTGNYTEQRASDTPETPALLIKGLFQLVYRGAHAVQIGEKDLMAFTHVTAMLNVWPFWREYVQSTTSRMGLPPLTLPLYRLGDVSLRPQDKPQKATASKKSPRKSRKGK